MNLCFLDTETTGLDPDMHEVWEVAWAIGNGPIRGGVVDHSGVGADPLALGMNGYRERAFGYDVAAAERLEADLRREVTGATIVGANPAFDAAFLRERWGEAPWHYRLIDIETYAMAVLDLDAPVSMERLHELLDNRVVGGFTYGLDGPDHSAAGDVLFLRAAWTLLRRINADTHRRATSRRRRPPLGGTGWPE